MNGYGAGLSVEHLIFALHYTAFAYLSASFFVLVGLGMVKFGGGAAEAAMWAPLVGLLVSPVYLYISLKKVYGESSMKTVVKTGFVFTLDAVWMILGTIVAQSYAVLPLFV